MKDLRMWRKIMLLQAETWHPAVVFITATTATGRFNALQIHWLKPPETISPLKRAAFVWVDSK
jgi:hypothetical protein